MCNKADNSCEYNKRKIIEIYLTENDDEFTIDAKCIEDTEISNTIMKKLIFALVNDIE